MSVRLYAEHDRARWDDYAQRSSARSAYHMSGWKRVIEASFGHRAPYLLSEHGSTVDGILPLVHLKSVLFGNLMVSLPYVNYGGVRADGSRQYEELLHAAIALAGAKRAAFIEFRDSEPSDHGLSLKTAKVTMELPLPQTVGELWQSFPSKLRSQIRRPQKEGLSARIGRADELDAFYRVFSENMRDLGTPVYSKRFFKNILLEFPDSTWICSVYRNQSPVGAALLVGFRDRLEIPWASTLRRFNRDSPNMLLYWTALEFACTSHYRVFDFGRSSPEGGTYRFKAQWGATPVQLYWYYWMRRDGPLPVFNPTNRRYQMAIRIWKHLPLGVTRLIGPMIVRNLP